MTGAAAVAQRRPARPGLPVMTAPERESDDQPSPVTSIATGEMGLSQR